MFVRLLIPLNTGASVKITLLRSAIWQSVGGISEFYSIICLRYGRRTSIKVPVILSHLFSASHPTPNTHFYISLLFILLCRCFSLVFLRETFFSNMFLTPYPHRIEYYTQFRFRFFLLHLKEKRIEIEAIKYISDFAFYIRFTFCIEIMIKLFASVYILWKLRFVESDMEEKHKNCFWVFNVLCLSPLLDAGTKIHASA